MNTVSATNLLHESPQMSQILHYACLVNKLAGFNLFCYCMRITYNLLLFAAVLLCCVWEMADSDAHKVDVPGVDEKAKAEAFLSAGANAKPDLKPNYNRGDMVWFYRRGSFKTWVPATVVDTR